MSDAASSAPAVHLDAVEKRYGDVVAVAGIDLDVRDGEFFSLLGPSGSGKTTTLRMIAGFEQPTAGRIELHGRDVTGVPPFDRDVNTVFQDYALFPHMSVGENVAYGLVVRKVGRDERARRVADALRMVRLEGFDARRPSQLSGGQRQRVALARALVNRPRVLLLDEPLGALDLKLREDMQIELKAIQQQVGITFIYVTHDQDEALTMSDRLAVFNSGRIEQVGAPADVYERPATRFVAGFVGNVEPPDGRRRPTDRRASGDLHGAAGEDPAVRTGCRAGARRDLCAGAHPGGRLSRTGYALRRGPGRRGSARGDPAEPCDVLDRGARPAKARLSASSGSDSTTSPSAMAAGDRAALRHGWRTSMRARKIAGGLATLADRCGL